MTLRELVAKFGLKVDESSFEKADQRLGKLKKAAVALGSMWAGSKVVNAVKNLTQETAALGDGLNILSARSGFAIDAIQELRYAGEAAGASIGDVDGSLQRFSRRLGAAARGNKAMASAFASVGLSLRDSTGKLRSMDEVLMDFSDRLAAMPSDAHRATAAQALMGRSGIALATALKGGSVEVARLRKEARELGLVEAELAAESSRLVLNQQRLRYAIQWIKTTIAGALLPWLNETIKSWLEWLRINRELVKMKLEQTVKTIAAALESVGRVVSSLVYVLKVAYDAWGKFGQTLAWVLGIASALLVVLGLKKTLALLTVAALWLLLDDFIVWLRGGESVIGEAIKAIKKLWSEFMGADYAWDTHPILKMLQEAVKLARQLAGLLPKPSQQRPGHWEDPKGHKYPSRGTGKQGRGATGSWSDVNLAGDMVVGGTTIPLDPHPRPARLASPGASVELNQTNNINIVVPPGADPGQIREEVQGGIEAANQSVIDLVPSLAGAPGGG